MIFRASSIHRRFSCPGSAKAEEGLPSEDSKDSKAGSLLHAYRANPRLERAVLSSFDRELLRISEDTEKFVFQTVSEKFGISEDEHYDQGFDKELNVARNGSVAVSGHTDRWRRYPNLKLVVIIDDKYGFRIVEAAASNLQLRSYGVGAVDEWPDTEIVCVAISQPRLPFSERCTLAAYNRDEIEASRQQLYSIVDAARKPNAPLHASELACRYCLAKTICPEFKRVVESGLSLVQLNGQLTKTAREAQIKAVIRQLSDEQLDKALLAVQFASWIADPARDEARRRKIENPDSLPQWSLGKASYMRRITNAKRAIQLLLLRGDLSKDRIYDCCSPVLGELETAIRENKNLTWKEAKQIVEDTLAPVLVREEKRHTLTRAGASND